MRARTSKPQPLGRRIARGVLLLIALGLPFGPGYAGEFEKELKKAQEMSQVDPKAAQAMAEKLIQDYPSRYEPQSLMTLIFASQGKASEARGALDKAFELAPPSDQSILLEVLRTLDPAAAKEKVDTVVAQAMQADGDGLMFAAAEKFKEAFWLDPTQGDWGLRAVSILVNLDENEAAVSLLRRVEKSAPPSFQPRVQEVRTRLSPIIQRLSGEAFEKAKGHFKKGDHDAALEALDEVLELEPSSGEGHFLKLRTLSRKGKAEEAIEAARLAIKHGIRDRERWTQEEDILSLAEKDDYRKLLRGAFGKKALNELDEVLEAKRAKLRAAEEKRKREEAERIRKEKERKRRKAEAKRLEEERIRQAEEAAERERIRLEELRLAREAAALEAAVAKKQKQLEAQAAAEAKRKADLEFAEGQANTIRSLMMKARTRAIQATMKNGQSFTEVSKYAKSLADKGYDYFKEGKFELARQKFSAAKSQYQSLANTSEVASDAKSYFTKLNSNPEGIRFVLIQAGSYRMGSNTGDSDERPVHSVKIPKPFYVATTETTQAHFQAIMGSNPSKFRKGSQPVEKVTWQEATSYAAKLQSRWNSQGRVPSSYRVRLPTETEWEYFARAGTTGDRYGGLGAIAWYKENSKREPHEVGLKDRNPWGLYDVLGNVWEWTLDPKHSSYNGAPSTNRLWNGGSSAYRVIRGGSWSNEAKLIRASNRFFLKPNTRYTDVGFRIVVAPR